MQSEIPDDVMMNAERLYDEGGYKTVPEIIAEAIMAERERCEAAMSAADPVATVAEMGAGGMRVLMPHPPGSTDHLPIGTKLYAAPPAPSVAVRALIVEFFKRNGWEVSNGIAYHEPGDIAVSSVCINDLLSALSAQVQDARSDDEEEIYEIGVREGYERAVQEIDIKTGGDGEYRYCTDHDPERHTPDASAMIQRIVDRFETLNLIGEAEKRGDFWDAPGSAQVQDESEIIECLLSGKPFVFDPSTNFCHRDDGGAPEHGIKYVPAAQVQDVAGWKLVPIEPTEEMKKAGREEAEDCEDVYGSAIYSTAEIYRAMLAAAPAKQEG